MRRGGEDDAVGDDAVGNGVAIKSDGSARNMITLVVASLMKAAGRTTRV